MEFSTSGDLLNCGGVFADAFFPGLAVHFNFHARADGGVRGFARKIRRAAFGGLHLNFLARLYLDQRLRGGAVLAVGLAPDFAAQHGDVVIHGDGPARAGPAGLAVGELVRVVQLIGADARLDFEPARASLTAGEQRAIGAGDFGIFAVRDGVADEVVRGIALGHGGHRAVELVLHGREHRGRGRLRGLRGCQCGKGRCENRDAGKENSWSMCGFHRCTESNSLR